MLHKWLQHTYISINLLNENRNYMDTKRGDSFIDKNKLLHSNSYLRSGTKRRSFDLDETVKFNDS